MIMGDLGKKINTTKCRPGIWLDTLGLRQNLPAVGALIRFKFSGLTSSGL
jgi:hypothetical protein